MYWNMIVRKAEVGDVEVMRAIIEEHSKRDKMLSRSLSYLYENIRDFFVVQLDGKIVGCVGLHISWADLAEIKSLAVSGDFLGKGVGKKLLDSAVNEARYMKIKNVFTLTLEPGFFKKYGFKQISRDELPMKIWGECIQCPKYPNCDETALKYEL